MTLAPGYAYSYQAGQKVYVRNVASNDWSRGASNFLSFNTGCTFKTVGGNINSLVNESASLGDYSFLDLFASNTYIKDASRLKLPWLSVSRSAYTEMFFGCTALTQPPALPGTTLGQSCYQGMFASTAIVTPPSLSAITTMSSTGCCYRMFYNCKSLASLPALSATALTDTCYRHMFYGCTNIKISTTQTGEYVNEYRIPTTGTGTVGASSLSNMFSSTGGTFTGTPTINTTYYTSNEVIS